MNITNTTTHFRRLLAAAVLGTLASGLTTVCSAADVVDAPQALVKFDDINVTTAPGAARLYSRIQAAAKSVCAPMDHGNLASHAPYRACLSKATADAVAKINQPTVTRVYEAKTGVASPIVVASSQP